MDRRTDWPWSSQEEAEWKAELEERDFDFLEELIDEAVDLGIPGSPYVHEPRETEKSAGNSAPEKYSVTV